LTAATADLVTTYLAGHRAAQLGELERFLAIPSISTLPVHRGDVRHAADVLAARMRAAGLPDVEVLETSGHPAVYGAWLGAPGRPTALVYGHYDVQPVDPLERWTTPPFQPAVRDGRLYARGAVDDKGQVWMHLMVAEAFLRAAGALPVNLKFLIEGEEESGSRGLQALVPARRELLAADLIVISDAPMFARDVPSLCYGLRGNTAVRVRVSGPAEDLHSGLFGGSVRNPLHALADLVAGLHDDDGRVTVPGFYDDVLPPSADERAAFAALPFDEAAYRAQLGVPELAGEAGFSTLERIWARPTLDLQGMWGGYQGEGSKSIVPAAAQAIISCRLVPDQRPERIQRALVAHLEAHRPQGVRLQLETRGSGAAALLTPLDAPPVKAALRALRHAYGREAVAIRMGGSIPVAATLTEALAAPLVLMGFGLPDDNLHAPDEHFDLGNYDRGQRTLVAYWLELGSDNR
jgi:acetylornithine deacetylase/succinyl-diaminopimelate desuccinylase-like protein